MLNDRFTNDTILGYSRIANFPIGIGAIHGTLIPIKAPNNDEHLSLTKFFQSISMAVSNVSLKFTNLVARWPSSCHDALYGLIQHYVIILKIGDINIGCWAYSKT